MNPKAKSGLLASFIVIIDIFTRSVLAIADFRGKPAA